MTLKRGDGVPREAGEQQCVSLGKGCSGGVADSLNGQGEEIRLDAGGSRE